MRATAHHPLFQASGHRVLPAKEGGARSVMRSAGLPVFLIGSPVNFADCLIGSPISLHYTAQGGAPLEEESLVSVSNASSLSEMVAAMQIQSEQQQAAVGVHPACGA